MIVRRMSSRRVALTASFLALAAGGTAACDSPEPTESSYESYESSESYEESSHDEESSDDAEEAGDVQEEEAAAEDETVAEDGEVFYCADEFGGIVSAEYCPDVGSAGIPYFLWHSTGYPRNLSPGDRLDGGDYFPADDRAARKAFGLKEKGLVANGTVKTNVVGRGSGGAVVSGGSGSSGS